MRNRWIYHCSSFNERTGFRKLWNTFKAITGKTKETAVRERLLLVTNLTEQEFYDEAARTFFPQPQDPPAPGIYAKESVPNDCGMKSLFNMQGLILAALDQVTTKSAPGKDGVTWNILRNLPDEGKTQLLNTMINNIWKKG